MIGCDDVILFNPGIAAAKLLCAANKGSDMVRVLRELIGSSRWRIKVQLNRSCWVRVSQNAMLWHTLTFSRRELKQPNDKLPVFPHRGNVGPATYSSAAFNINALKREVDRRLTTMTILNISLAFSRLSIVRQSSFNLPLGKYRYTVN